MVATLNVPWRSGRPSAVRGIPDGLAGRGGPCAAGRSAAIRGDGGCRDETSNETK